MGPIGNIVSLLRMEERNSEIFIVNSLSTYSTLELIDKQVDSHLCYLYQYPGTGTKLLLMS